MDIQDSFSDWFSSYRLKLPFSSFVALEADVARQINEERQRYRQADVQIRTDIEKGEKRRYGKPKLRLKSAELLQHMQARKDRATAHQRLTVLVALARRLKIVHSQWNEREPHPAPESALDAAIWLLPLTLPIRLNTQTKRVLPPKTATYGYGGEVERQLAKELVRKHPRFFYIPEKIAPEPSEAELLKEKRTALYHKVMATGALTADEQALLRHALVSA